MYLKLAGYSIVRDDPLIVSLAEKYKATPTQIIFAWHLSRNTIIVPKSENSQRQKENITVRAYIMPYTSMCHCQSTAMFGSLLLFFH